MACSNLCDIYLSTGVVVRSLIKLIDVLDIFILNIVFVHKKAYSVYLYKLHMWRCSQVLVILLKSIMVHYH